MAVSLSDPYNGEWELMFEDPGGSTRMTMHIDASLSGIQGLLSPLLTGWTHRINQQGLDAFQADVESREPFNAPRPYGTFGQVVLSLFSGRVWWPSSIATCVSALG